jgi:hydroxymethylpyrimidine pyrophosphatase-like HAD family hydrolase
MRHPFGCREHAVCKQNALLHLGQQLQMTPDRILAVGDGLPDCCMFAAAGVSVAFQPKSPEVANAADFVIHDNLIEIETLLGVPD